MQRLQRLRGTYGWRVLGPDATLWALLLAPVAFAAAVLQMALSPVDPDYWWHLATGRWMLDHHRIPFTDPFSVSHGGQTWYAHEWLSELIFAVSDKIGGFRFNIVLTALAVAAGAWFLGRACRLYGSGSLLALLLVVGGSFFIINFLAVRPQVLGWALLALLIHEICANDTQCATLWRVPFIFALWVNIHLSVELGAVVLALYGAHRGLRWLLSRRRTEQAAIEFSRFTNTLIVGGVSALALCLNPRGPFLLWFSRVYADPNAERWKYIGEWQKPAFQGDERYLFIGGGIVLVLTLLAMLTRRALWPGILAVLFAVAALRANRYGPIFGTVAIPVAGWLLARFNRRNVALRPARFSPLLFGSLCAASVACIVIGAWQRGPTEFRRVADAHPGNYPVAAVAYVKNNVPGGGVISEYGWGGYLIFSFYPERRVYMDGREEMYGETFFKNYVQTMAGEGDWQKRLAQAGVTAAILGPREGLAVAMSRDPAWQAVYQDPIAVVYVRTDQPDTEPLPSASAGAAFARR
jgi:hypothetical protein